MIHHIIKTNDKNELVCRTDSCRVNLRLQSEGGGGAEGGKDWGFQNWYAHTAVFKMESQKIKIIKIIKKDLL